MVSMEEFIDKWLSLRKEGETAVATLVNGYGSRPREDGAHMLIAASGAIEDTIGGGLVEAEVISHAKTVLSGKSSEIYSFNSSGEDADKSGMICGGGGEAVIYYSPEKDIEELGPKGHDRNSNKGPYVR
jgi:xanthine/CO dehydrogenase XdhC/CoxF family maturation factor